MLQTRIFDILRLLIFASLQVFIFNNINFYGYADPYVYILFILLLPFSRNKYLVLTYAFFLGLYIDFFENTGGLNAFACVLIAFLRQPLVKLLLSKSTQTEEELSLSQLSFFQWGIYLALLIFSHHILIDWLQTMSLSQWQTIIERSSLGAVLTLIICFLYLAIFPFRKKQEL